MRKIISYFLVGTILSTLLIGCATNESNKSNNVAVIEQEEVKDLEIEEDDESNESANIQLNKIDSFSRKQNEVSIYNGGLILKDGDGVRVLDYMGNDNLGKTYAGAACLYDEYWVVYNGSDDMNSCGLVNIDGTELIPCEAAWISNELWTQGSTQEPRFILVFYSTGKTENKEEALVYSSEHLTFMGTPPSDSVFYTGYAKVFDLQENKFVDGIEVTKDNLDVYACGDSIIELKDGKTYLYDANGKLIDEFDKISSTDIDCINGHFVINENDKSVLYACEGNEILSSSTDDYKYNMYGSFDTSEYIEVCKDSKYGISDLNGNLILPIVYNQVYDICNGYVSVKTDNSEYKLICLETGEQVGPTLTSSEYKSLDYGYWYSKMEGDGYVYINAEGEVFEDLPYAPGLCIRSGEYGEGYQYYIWKDRDYSFECTQGNDLATGLIWAQNEDGLNGVFETFTGAMLLDYEYSSLKAQDGYVYAYKDGVFDVYEIVNE